SGAGRTSDGNGSHASTLKSPSYTKSVSWQHYLTFGYEVNDIHGHNIGVVGQGSQLFIRTNEVPPSVNVAIDKQQGLSCTITFGKEIDESKNYICR
ncbi:hypothetical protein L2V99_21470, partial [Escherichia coli]|nr:hypothetical protein [Escherichia coli]